MRFNKTELPVWLDRRFAARVAFGAASVFIVGQFCLDLRLIASVTPENRAASASLLAALLAYLASHAFRFLRFAVLMGGARLSKLAHLYLLTIGASYAIPFKLGELFRIFWIGRCTGSVRRGFIVVWVERILDASVISLLYATILIARPEAGLPPMTGALTLIPFLIVLSVMLLKVLPENLHNLTLWILRSYKGAEATRRLKAVSFIRRFSEEAAQTLANRTLSLVMLSTCIWGLELYAAYLALPSLEGAAETVAIFIARITAILSPGRALGTSVTQAFDALALAQGLLIGMLAMLSIALSAGHCLNKVGVKHR